MAGFTKLFFGGFSAGKTLFGRRLCKHFLALLFGERLRIGVFGDFGILFAIGDVWTVWTVHDLDVAFEFSDVLVGIFFEFGFVEFQRFVKRDSKWIEWLDADKSFVHLDVWTESTDVGFDVFTILSGAH
jgi:hypothetical protein